MKLAIEVREDPRRLGKIYTIYFYQLKIADYFLCDWQLLDEKRLPVGFKVLKFFVQLFCKHEWKKIGTRRMEGYLLADFNTYYQDIICNTCKKESTYSYRSEF